MVSGPLVSGQWPVAVAGSGLLADNQHLSHVLWAKGIWHKFRVWSGRAHGYRRWREMISWFA